MQEAEEKLTANGQLIADYDRQHVALELEDIEYVRCVNSSH